MVGFYSDRYQINTIETDDCKVVVHWLDGHTSRFHSIWLRHNCSCEHCGATESAIRELKLTDIPSGISPASVTHNRNNLHIVWHNDHHQSHYSTTWLRNNCYSEKERENRRFTPKLWGPLTEDAVPVTTYADVSGNQTAQLDMLEKLRDYGIVWMRQGPADADATESIAELVGNLRITNYGAVYDFVINPTPLVKGDTGSALNPHTDEPYRIQPPAITFFHSIRANPEIAGGISTFVDAFFVAEKLRQEHPHSFELLCTQPQGFHRTLADGPRHFRTSAPVFSRDFAGDVCGFRLLDRAAAPLDLPEDTIEPYYAAMRILLAHLYDEQNQTRVALNPGDVLVFNNQRVLHGRTRLDPGRAERYMRSCHVELDEFYSKLRVLSELLKGECVAVPLPASRSA